ncbi:MAG: hypothetical protein L3K08_06660 [Thermoplasmata archaeon]|nr:hypothetical protein [Thermoplasmata archaeon]
MSSNARLVYQYGPTHDAGNGLDQRYGPYSADDFGDFTKQTVPLAQFR